MKTVRSSPSPSDDNTSAKRWCDREEKASESESVVQFAPGSTFTRDLVFG